MEFGHYNDSSVEMAVELVNSEPLLGEPDDLADVDQLRDFVARHLPSWREPVAEADVADVHRVRGTLRSAFLAENAEQAARLLNGLLIGAAAVPQLDDHDGWHLHVKAAKPGLANHIAAVAALGVAMVVAEHGVARLGLCSSDTCIDAFVDTTKNRSRRYCSEGCANVSAVRKHRQRARSRQP